MSEMEVDVAKPQPTITSLLKNKDKVKESSSDEPGSKSKRVVFQDKPIILNKSEEGVSGKTVFSEHEKPRDRRERGRPLTKVVIRRLPPNMTLEMFIDHVSPLPEHDYIYFVKADLSLGPNAFSRAYINFINISDLLTFYEQFDNYVFMDNKGNEYPAVVEFSPLQRVPKKRLSRKKDPKAGTLKEDPAYIAFAQSLLEKKDENETKQTSVEHLLALTTENSSKKEKTTPLLEFLKQRKAERQRIRDEKREERRRKELERKRIKEEERRRRKDGDLVTQEDKDDGGRVNKDRDRPPSSLRRREDDRQRNRDRDRRDSRPVQDTRPRDVKTRSDSGPKSYRDERPKQVQQRKPPEDTRKKPGLGPNKFSDTRRSQEFDKKDVKKEGEREEKKPYGGYQGDRRNYRDIDNKRNQGYDRRKNAYGNDRKYSYSDSRRSNDHRTSNKPETKPDKETKPEKDTKPEVVKTEEQSEEKKWELLGAKPKTKVVAEKKKPEQAEPPGIVLKRRVSPERKEPKTETEGDIKKDIETPEVTTKRRSSLDSDLEKSSSKEPKRQSSLDPEASVGESPLDESRKGIPLSKSQEFEKTSCSDIVHKRRGSLDSGDHSKPNGEQTDTSSEKDRGDSASVTEENKRDPRAERRIRNKDRPSIEIYRPGMGRFSMQRKEREKSTEQESPSESPSPTPTGRQSKSSKELRSMTFKRSVSREK